MLFSGLDMATYQVDLTDRTRITSPAANTVTALRGQSAWVSTPVDLSYAACSAAIGSSER